MVPVTPAWIERMSLRRWYAISGDHPDLELLATAPGTRYLVDNDPARNPQLNPARTIRGRLRKRNLKYVRRAQRLAPSGTA